jgi:hypothetical protein
MAVYQGARRRGFEFQRPSLGIEVALPAAGRTPPRTSSLAGHGRPTRVGLALAGILVAFTLGFLWLSQSVRVAATSYDVVRLTSEWERLDALRQDLRSNLDRLGAEPAIRKLGLDDGLGQLGAPFVIPAR